MKCEKFREDLWFFFYTWFHADPSPRHLYSRYWWERRDTLSYTYTRTPVARLIHIFRDGSMRYRKLFRRNVGRAAQRIPAAEGDSASPLRDRRNVLTIRLMDIYSSISRYARRGVSLAAARTRGRICFSKKVIPISRSGWCCHFRRRSPQHSSTDNVIFRRSHFLISWKIRSCQYQYYLVLGQIYLISWTPEKKKLITDISREQIYSTLSSLSAELIYLESFLPYSRDLENPRKA